MDEVVQKVIRLFPEYEDSIYRLWKQDNEFRGLCRDYNLCLDVKEKISASTHPGRKSEYQKIQRYLEFELRLNLVKKPNH